MSMLKSRQLVPSRLTCPHLLDHSEMGEGAHPAPLSPPCQDVEEGASPRDTAILPLFDSHRYGHTESVTESLHRLIDTSIQRRQRRADLIQGISHLSLSTIQVDSLRRQRQKLSSLLLPAIRLGTCACEDPTISVCTAPVGAATLLSELFTTSCFQYTSVVWVRVLVERWHQQLQRILFQHKRLLPVQVEGLQARVAASRPQAASVSDHRPTLKSCPQRCLPTVAHVHVLHLFQFHFTVTGQLTSRPYFFGILSVPIQVRSSITWQVSFQPLSSLKSWSVAAVLVISLPSGLHGASPH